VLRLQAFVPFLPSQRLLRAVACASSVPRGALPACLWCFSAGAGRKMTPSMWTKICSPKCEGRQSAFTFLGAIFRPEDGPFFGGAPPLRVMRAGARACHDDACCSVHMSFARYTFSPRASSVSEGPMMATAPCVARSRGASSCALCEDLGYMQCAASLPPQQSVFRRDAVAGHAAVPRGMCGLGQRCSDKMYCH